MSLTVLLVYISAGRKTEEYSYLIMANGHLGAERKNVPVPITVPKPDATKFTEGKLAHLTSRGPLLTGFRQKLMRVILGDFRSILSG